jgi:hypothetical protein
VVEEGEDARRGQPPRRQVLQGDQERVQPPPVLDRGHPVALELGFSRSTRPV